MGREFGIKGDWRKEMNESIYNAKVQIPNHKSKCQYLGIPHLKGQTQNKDHYSAKKPYSIILSDKKKPT
jgi:hypothetical protein